jgi:Right handed beta helix region/PKD domain
MKASVLFFSFMWFVLSFVSGYGINKCNCTFTLTGLKTKSVNIINASSFPTYKPGDIFCISAGTYAEFRFIDFHGTSDKPLIFKNCGGKVVIEGIAYPGIGFRLSSHIRLTGTGVSEEDYGFHIRKTNKGSSGVVIGGLSTDFEVDHLEISGVAFAGIMAKTDPQCDNPKTWRENFTMRNLYFHNNYIHDTGGEGFYVGSTQTKDCTVNVKAHPHFLENVSITNNIIENTGWDGLQLNLAVLNAEISNNVIHGYGAAKERYQNQGISSGGCTIKIFNNKIIQNPDYAIRESYGMSIINPLPGSYIFNNLVVGSGGYGIWTHIRTPLSYLSNYDLMKPENGFYYINNTIVDPGTGGIFYNTRAGEDARGDDFIHAFYNNLIVDPKLSFSDIGFGWKKSDQAFINYNDEEQKDFALLANNLFSRDKSKIKFANVVNNDFMLLKGSEAIDFGKDVSLYGITFDLNNGSRPAKEGFDAGAFEYGVTNVVPVVHSKTKSNALVGENFILDGSVCFDPDGTIARCIWSQVSGPKQLAISGASDLRASVTFKVSGTYVFRLTVTDNKGAKNSVQVNVVVTDLPKDLQK